MPNICRAFLYAKERHPFYTAKILFLSSEIYGMSDINNACVEFLDR